MRQFKEAVLKAFGAFNHFRSPEATAKLVKMDNGELTIDNEDSSVELREPTII